MLQLQTVLNLSSGMLPIYSTAVYVLCFSSGKGKFTEKVKFENDAIMFNSIKMTEIE